jgi:hypothetical protein
MLSSVWVFGSYGGWRDLSVVILEPCTGYPAQLDQAIAQGTVRTLLPSVPWRTDVVASIFTMHQDGRT